MANNFNLLMVQLALLLLIMFLNWYNQQRRFITGLFPNLRCDDRKIAIFEILLLICAAVTLLFMVFGT